MVITALTELQKTMPQTMETVFHQPEAPATVDHVRHLIALLDQILASRELAVFAEAAPAGDRAPVAAVFQRVVDNLRAMASVPAQIQQLGGDAPYSGELAGALRRLETRLIQLGFSIGPSERPLPVVHRHPLTGEFRVHEPVPATEAQAPVGAAAAPGPPPAEQGPQLVEKLRQLLATVGPERLEFLDGERAALGAQHLSQTLRFGRTFLAQTHDSEHRRQPWYGALAELLDRMERTIRDLNDIVAAEAVLKESGNRIPYEQILERLAFQRLLPSLADTYHGQYVAVHKGRVVDADQSQRALVRRFIKRFGDSSLYVGFVGPTPMVRIPTPILRRSS